MLWLHTPRKTGEAQIAVVDLLGMLSGIGLCTMVGTSRRAIVAAYVLLSVIDISAIYLEIRAVVFTVLNHERTHLLARDYVASGSDPAAMRRTLKTGLPVLADGIAVGGGGDGDGGGGVVRERPLSPSRGWSRSRRRNLFCWTRHRLRRTRGRRCCRPRRRFRGERTFSWLRG